MGQKVSKVRFYFFYVVVFIWTSVAFLVLVYSQQHIRLDTLDYVLLIY
jgi:hypothetical protein